MRLRTLNFSGEIDGLVERLVDSCLIQAHQRLGCYHLDVRRRRFEL